MKHTISLVLLNFFISTSSLAVTETSSLAVNNISVKLHCNINDKLINFDKYYYDPDFTVKFSRYSFDSDLIVKVVDNELFADVVIKDNQDNQDYSFCKSRNGLTIKISEFSSDPDITINILNNYSYKDPDFTIFSNSKILSLEEAISLILVPTISLIDIIHLKKTFSMEMEEMNSLDYLDYLYIN